MNIKLNGYNLLTSESCRIYLHFSVTFQWLLIKIITYKVYFSSVYTLIYFFLFLPQYLALFDLVHLSQFSLTRRKQIFSLSQPSEIYFSICPYCSRCKFPILVHVHNSVWPYTTYFCQIQKITTSLTLSLPWVTRT